MQSAFVGRNRFHVHTVDSTSPKPTETFRLKLKVLQLVHFLSNVTAKLWKVILLRLDCERQSVKFRLELTNLKPKAIHFRFVK